jgi:hypothetical protein
MIKRKGFDARSKETGQGEQGLTVRCRRYWRLAGTLIVLLYSSTSHATYNTNLIGTVAAIMTYASGGLLFALSNQPSSNGTCNAQFFELDPPEGNAKIIYRHTFREPGFDRRGYCHLSGSHIRHHIHGTAIRMRLVRKVREQSRSHHGRMVTENMDRVMSCPTIRPLSVQSLVECRGTCGTTLSRSQRSVCICEQQSR